MVTSEVLTGRTIDKPLFVFAQSQRNPAGQVSAVSYAAVDTGWLARELATSPLPAGRQIMLLDDRGLITLLAPDPKGLTGGPLVHPVFQKLTSTNEEGVVEATGVDGTRRLYGHLRLLTTTSGHHYSLLLGVPKAALVADAQRALLLNLALALVLAAAALTLVLVGGNRLLLGPLLTTLPLFLQITLQGLAGYAMHTQTRWLYRRTPLVLLQLGAALVFVALAWAPSAAALLGLPLGYWQVFIRHGDPAWLWWGLSLALGVVAVSLALRFAWLLRMRRLRA